MSTDVLVEKTKSIKAQNKAMIKAAIDMTKATKAKHLFLYIDAVDDDLLPEILPKGVHLILVTKKKEGTWDIKLPVRGVLTLPTLKLGRMGMVKIAVILAIVRASAYQVSPFKVVVLAFDDGIQAIHCQQ